MKIDFERVTLAIESYCEVMIKKKVEYSATFSPEALYHLDGKISAAKEIKAMLKRLIKKNGGDL